MRYMSIFFSLTLFLSAFLTFSIQPIMGKLLLPLVGGAPSIWLVAMAFFQLALLLGYGVSWLMSRFTPWINGLALLALYGVGWVSLPIALDVVTLGASVQPTAWDMIRVLMGAVFLPFVALSATTAALQRIFSVTRHTTAHDPYYLFVASNAGSLLGLLSYPFGAEIFLGLSQQKIVWQYGFALAFGFVLVSMVLARSFKNPSNTAVSASADHAEPVNLTRIMRWIALAFIPCSLSMGVTTLITTDIGSIPLFYIIPLGLYLITFILAFAQRAVFSPAMLDFLHCAAVVIIIALTALNILEKTATASLMGFLLNSTVMLLAFFIVAWSCHQKLADNRPASRYLPFYYFTIALGGAAAGLVHVFLLPIILDHVIEFSVTLIISLVLTAAWSQRIREIPLGRLKKPGYYYLALVLLSLSVVFFHRISPLPLFVLGVFGFIFIVAFLCIALQPRLVMSAGIAMLALMMITDIKGVLYSERNFFGTQQVYEIKRNDQTVRIFMHGNTMHGKVIFDAENQPISYNSGYYVQNGPIRDVFDVARAKRVAVVGLGTGQMACFDKNVATDFYEIDPDVLTVAKQYFPYLEDCPVQDIIIGDGRVRLAHTDHSYDIIMLDAFNSDGVPLHLLTREAQAIYTSKLNPRGITLYHISNRYLALARPIAALAAHEGKIALTQMYIPPKSKADTETVSQWVVIVSHADQAQALRQKGWKDVKPAKHVWTDDRASVLTALKKL